MHIQWYFYFMRLVRKQYVLAFYVALFIGIVYAGLSVEVHPHAVKIIEENFWTQDNKLYYQDRQCAYRYAPYEVPIRAKQLHIYNKHYFGDKYSVWFVSPLYCNNPAKVELDPQVHIPTFEVLATSTYLARDRHGLIGIVSQRSPNGNVVTHTPTRVADTSGRDYVHKGRNLVAHAGKLYFYRDHYNDSEIANTLLEIENADPEMYHELVGTYGYAADDDSVFYAYKLLPDARPQDFQKIGSSTTYFYSSGYIYSYGKRIASVKGPEDFRKVGDQDIYWTNGEKVFYANSDIEVDAQKFAHYTNPVSNDSSVYAGDGKKIYYRLELLKDADPSTFRIIQGIYARDAQRFYMSGQIMEGNPDEWEQKALKGELDNNREGCHM